MYDEIPEVSLFPMRDRPTSAYSQASSINPSRVAHLIAPPQKEAVDPNKVSVSDLSAALVREYLVSKGYRKTLEVFGTEDSVVIFLATKA